MSTDKKITALVRGMHCASCAKIIESTIVSEPGVKSIRINQASEEARLVLEPGVEINNLNEKIKSYGYSFYISKDEKKLDNKVQSLADEKQKTLQHEKNIALFTFPLSLLMAGLMLWEVLAGWSEAVPIFFLPMGLYTLISFVLASVILFTAGWGFVKAAGRFFIKWRGANMDTLVGIGTVTAYLFSTFILLAPDLARALNLNTVMFFDVTIVVIGFVKFGKYLEAKAKLSVSRAMTELLNMQAKSAVVEIDGEEIETPIEEVVLGQSVIVKPGARIPLDGEIIFGESAVNEALLTGESLPVDKNIGDQVYAGTINEQGYLIFKVTKNSGETMLAQIIAMVDEAQCSKAPIERLADRVSSIFVPVVLSVALITLLAWLFIGGNYYDSSTVTSLALTCFVGVLVIACPCALGLATPTGVIVGVELATKRGILIKKAESLEKLGRVKIVMFDKTGTLTQGKPKVTDVVALSTIDDNKILQISASLEKQSEHPLARTIVQQGKDKKLAIEVVENFKAIRGQGISGIVEKQQYYFGNLKLMADLNLSFNLSQLEKLSRQGKTVMILATNKECLGLIAVADILKTETKQAIIDLKKLGVKLVMLTGDKKETAMAIAVEAGIDNVEAEVLPEAKAQLVKKYQLQGVTAMVGDGVNDAVALITADIGVAMATGSDVAIESADITLLHGDLSKLLSAIKISRLTMSKIKQNLFLAFVYNIIAIPIAAGAFYASSGLLLNPGLAAAAMSLSSVSVVMNTLLMRRAKI